jgi:hypothetical protein
MGIAVLKIGPAAAADQERIAGEHRVVDDVRDGSQRVPRDVQDRDAEARDFEGCAFFDDVGLLGHAPPIAYVRKDSERRPAIDEGFVSPDMVDVVMRAEDRLKREAFTFERALDGACFRRVDDEGHAIVGGHEIRVVVAKAGDGDDAHE